MKVLEVVDMADKSPVSSQPPELQGYTLATRKIVMYPDLNAAGRLFGGQMLSWMDEATAMVAMSIMQVRRIVTRKFGEVVFDAPGMLGDVLEIWCKPAHEGRSSLTLDCLVVGIRESRTPVSICRCNVVYVALDADGRPMEWKKG